MKTKEELLKIYSSYLPYELKLYHESHFKSNKIIENWGLKNCSDYPISEYCDGSRYGRTFQEVKPILYSMDYLTKEIEHRSERFLPIERIAKELDMTVAEKCFLEQNLVNSSFELLRCTSYDVIAKLLEYHFNVFQLSDSEYIKKETLNK